VASAQRARAGVIDAAIFEMRDGDKLLARESVRLKMLPLLSVRTAGTAWTALSPDAVVGNVNNLFMKQPDQTKWYHGAADLSGKVWVRKTAEGNLVVAAAIRDDIDKPKDGIVIRLASGENFKTRLELRSDGANVTRKRDDAAGITWYEATIASSAFSFQPRERIAVNVLVDDDDWGELKQTASISTSDNPDGWYQTWSR
jgi:hypothetical protein